MSTASSHSAPGLTLRSSVAVPALARIASGLLLVSAAGVAAGQQHPPPGADCLEVADASQRLDCFDREVGAAVRGDEAVTEAEIPAATPREAEVQRPPGFIDMAWGFLPDSNRAYIRLYYPNYILFARYTTNLNLEPYEPLRDESVKAFDFENIEAKFQLSFKARLLTTSDRRWGLWFAYTQESWWQVYNADISRPFRENNYMPEVLGSVRPGVQLGGWHFNLINLGFNHQSNGRPDPISRSWDRLFVEAAIEKDDFVLVARAWARIRLGNYEDDNPDITDYLGYGQVTAFYRRGENSFTLWARGNLNTGKGAAELTWTTRKLLGPMHGYVQIFTGYGESMIDYNKKQTTIGFGLTLNDRF
jgi:phospholipase A1/A2